MTKKERIAQLEKEVDELKQRIATLEQIRIVGIGDIRPYIPSPEPYTYPVTHPWIPVITYCSAASF